LLAGEEVADLVVAAVDVEADRPHVEDAVGDEEVDHRVDLEAVVGERVVVGKADDLPAAVTHPPPPPWQCRPGSPAAPRARAPAALRGRPPRRGGRAGAAPPPARPGRRRYRSPGPAPAAPALPPAPARRPGRGPAPAAPRSARRSAP